MITIKNHHISYHKIWDVNNLYGWAMSKRLRLGWFKWVEETFQFNEDFIKIYNDDSDERYFLETDVQCLENWHNFQNDLLILTERIQMEKAEKLVVNLHDKEENVIHMRNLKPALNRQLVLKKVHRVIKFDYMILKDKLINNAFSEKTMENVRKNRDIKFLTAEARRNYSMSKPNYSTTKKIFWQVLEIEMKKHKYSLINQSIWIYQY